MEKTTMRYATWLTGWLAGFTLLAGSGCSLLVDTSDYVGEGNRDDAGVDGGQTGGANEIDRSLPVGRRVLRHVGVARRCRDPLEGLRRNGTGFKPRGHRRKGTGQGFGIDGRQVHERGYTAIACNRDGCGDVPAGTIQR